MTRPCQHAGKAPDPESCRACYWCADCSPEGRYFRQAWGEPEPDCPGNSVSFRLHPGVAVVDARAARDRTRWPAPARALALLRRPEDRGLGDTAARVLARFGAERIKGLYVRLTGRDCGCGDRQARLNEIFPFAPES